MSLVLDVRFTFLYHQFLHVLLCGGRIRHKVFAAGSVKNWDLKGRDLWPIVFISYRHVDIPNWAVYPDQWGRQYQVNQHGIIYTLRILYTVHIYLHMYIVWINLECSYALHRPFWPYCTNPQTQPLWPRMIGHVQWNQPGCGPKPFATQDLGRLKGALTKWGYVGGKINFIICTYLMCIAPWKGFKVVWTQWVRC